MFGKIQLERFEGITTMPQEAASAWSGAFEDLVGATYKPLLYLGKQLVHGVNHYFVAEQTLITNPPCRRVVKLAINVDDNDCELIEDSIEAVI